MTNYDVISDNMGIHDHMLCISKVLTMENAKRVELGFSVIQLLYVYRFKICTTKVCFERVEELAINNLLFIEYLKIQNGCQSWLLIAATKIVSCRNFSHFKTISTVIKMAKPTSYNSWLDPYEKSWF